MEYFKGVEIIDKEIKTKVRTEQVYKVFNQFMRPLISNEEFVFLEKLEKYLLQEVEPKIDYAKDVYELFPILGKGNYMQRLNKYGDMKHYGMRYELLLAMAISILDPELDLARVVSGLIFTNPIFLHGKSERMKKILEEVLSGEKIGCICITEREQGSDAVNMKTLIEDHEDYITITGEKIFTTNGPKADYFIVYGVSDVNDPRKTMYQAIIERNFEGLETNRLAINSVPRVHIGQTLMKSVKIPYNNIIGGRGQGHTNLFSGLVAERDTIVGSSLGISWLSLITALIYTNLRKQFNLKVYKFQAVSFPIAQLASELVAATVLGLRTGSEYRKFLEHPEFKFIRYNAAFSSGAKIVCSRLAHRCSYEAQHICGGIGFTDNLKLEKAVQVSKLQEVIGGTRNIQLFLVSNVIKNILKNID